MHHNCKIILCKNKNRKPSANKSFFNRRNIHYVINVEWIFLFLFFSSFLFYFSHSKILVTFREKMIPTEQGSYVTIQFTTLRFIFAYGKVKIKDTMSLTAHRLIKH